jgi:RNA polymerase sigma factor FliA
VVDISEGAEIHVLCQSGVDLVKLIAHQVRRTIGQNLGFDELVSCGNEGLLDAARRFDQSRGIPFRAFAYFRIRGAMLDGVRSAMPLPRRAWGRLRGLEALNQITGSMRDEHSGWGPPLEADAADVELGDHLVAMVTALSCGMMSRRSEELDSIAGEFDSDPEQAAMQAELYDRHYLDGQRFDEVAEQLCLSKSWASRLHRRAIDRLAKLLDDEI